MKDNKKTITKETLSEIDDAKEDRYLKKIEAALFISGKWQTLQELSMLTELNPVLLRRLLGKLGERYGDESAIEIINKNNGELWKMDVRKEHIGIVNKLATGKAEFSKAEQETLAVIAYKRPVKQSVVVKIRGNKAYDHIKKFRDVGLLRAKKTGRTWELDLSQDFYDYFNISEKNKDINLVDKSL